MNILYQIQLQRSKSPQRIEIELDNTSLSGARFTEHGFNRKNRSSTDRILASSQSLLFESLDLGNSWDVNNLADISMINNTFICSNDDVLVSGTDKKNNKNNRIVLIRDKHVISSNVVGLHGWHGTFSIDQSEEYIMYSEYADNNVHSKHKHCDTTCNVFRSSDHGLTWQSVFQVDFPDIRHFHTCTYIPNNRTWVITSGDTPEQSRFWLSKNNGDTWTEITDQYPDVNSVDKYIQSVHRTVVMHFNDKYYIWATDDPIGDIRDFDKGYENINWLPIQQAVEYRVLIRDYTKKQIILKSIIPSTNCNFKFYWEKYDITNEYRYRIQYRRTNNDKWEDTCEYIPLSRQYLYKRHISTTRKYVSRSRLIFSPKTEPLKIDVRCELGMHIRSMIDIGEAYLFISEAKYLNIAPTPQVYLVFKNDTKTCHHLFNIPNRNNIITGATYSRSSIVAKNGVFFTQMQRGLLFDDNEIVRWKVTLH